MILLLLTTLSFSFAHSPTGELTEVRLEGKGLREPVRLEIATPGTGLGSKIIAPLSQAVANALRDCNRFSDLIAADHDGIEFGFFIEPGRLEGVTATQEDRAGSIRCAADKIQDAKISVIPFLASNLKGVLRVRASER